MQDVFLFLGRRTLEGEDFLQLDSLKIEPLIPFKKWRIGMKEFFQKTEHGTFLDSSEEIEFDLYFEAETPPCGYLVERFSQDKGKRYEQPGSLRGKARVGDRTMNFEGQGIRDHSWELRDVSKWEDWFGMMGWFESGDAVTLVNITSGDTTFCEGWQRTDNYHEVLNARMNPVSDVLKMRHICIETSKEKLEIVSRPFSFVTIPTGEQSTMTEILVELEQDENHGHGFLWCGGLNRS